ncbi:Ku protein [Candidatus Parcubacteria bacterium]|nr:Ku protein [Candidatus Parcubacteria bacterium]
MRAIWTGSLSFGLINIPVSLYSASKDRALKFKLLSKHGHCPVSYARICRDTGEKLEWKDIEKGYEYEKGDFVVLTDEDFKKASPKKTKLIDIVSFTDEKEIPVKHIGAPYYVEPDKKAEKAYVLLREALRRSKKVGIARFVLKEKEHIGMLRPEDDALMLSMLRFKDELREPEDLRIPGKEAYSKKELDIALLLIDKFSEHFKASDYKDTYTEDLKKIIEKKAKGKPIRLSKEAVPVPTDMRHLMDILKKSLEEEKTKS